MPGGVSLPAFWGAAVAEHINSCLEGQPASEGRFVLHCAADEDWALVDAAALRFPVVRCRFPESASYERQGEGSLTRHLIEQRVRASEGSVTFKTALTPTSTAGLVILRCALAPSALAGHVPGPGAVLLWRPRQGPRLEARRGGVGRPSARVDRLAAGRPADGVEGGGTAAAGRCGVGIARGLHPALFARRKQLRSQ